MIVLELATHPHDKRSYRLIGRYDDEFKANLEFKRRLTAAGYNALQVEKMVNVKDKWIQIQRKPKLFIRKREG